MNMNIKINETKNKMNKKTNTPLPECPCGLVTPSLEERGPGGEARCM
jgi:hypothetical protein